MNKIVGFGLAAAAVVIAAFVGIQLLGGLNVGGPAPSGGSSDGSPVQLGTGPLEPGTRYSLSFDDVALTLAVPTAGWSGQHGQITGHPGAPEETNMWFYTSASGPNFTTPAVFPDPCTHEGATEFEDSVAGEVEAWTAVPGTELVSAPSDVTVDGHAATSVVIVIPEDAGCENSEFWLLYDPACGTVLGCTTYPTWLGETIRIWIVDRGDGSRFTIRAEVRSPDASPDVEQEIQQIVDSIQMEGED